MPTITSVVKRDGHLVITYSDGVVVQRSIVYDDTVTSLPPEGYEEVGVIYVDDAAGTLIVNYNGQSITLGAGIGDGDMLKSVYDTDNDGTVDDAEKLEGSTKAQVQDHTPQAHKDSHDANTGSDKLDTAAPGTNITPEQANAVGTAETFARSDHMHYIPSGAPSTVAAANSEGTGAAFARTDHIHAREHAKYTDNEAKTQAEAAKLDDHGTPDDNVDLDASTSRHGLAVKATAPAANILNVVGLVNGETAYTNKPIHDGTNPEALGSVGPGTSLLASHRDHVHALPAIDATGAATDIATRNASTSAHGLLKKLDNTATNFMDGTGNWSAPAGGGSDAQALAFALMC